MDAVPADWQWPDKRQYKSRCRERAFRARVRRHLWCPSRVGLVRHAAGRNASGRKCDFEGHLPGGRHGVHARASPVKTCSGRAGPPCVIMVGFRSHGSTFHSEFLDHRAHRSRQVDAGRSFSRADRRAPAPGDVGPGPRQHGPRARARDHDQGPRRAAELPRRRRAGLRPQPDRHARPRRLFVRGHAIARGLRGRAAARRRVAGRRGADARERVSRRREQPRDHPGHQQDRSARARSPTRSRRQIEEIIGLDAKRRHSREREGGPRRLGHPRGDRPPAAAARRRCRRAAQGADLRLLVRPVSRRRHPHAHHRRRHAARA